jgi:hypothetical protein
MKFPEPNITVNVDLTNPGQFFACCGLLELADRLWPGAEGWFAGQDTRFCIACAGTLPQLITSLHSARLVHCNPEDDYSSPIEMQSPFRPLRVDWWSHEILGAKDLKVWAGTMESFGIAQAMQKALRDTAFQQPNLFDVGLVVQNVDDPNKKKEPYYFDARRAPNAHSRDTGFSTNDLGLTSTAHPAVELLCLIGLQVARPRKTGEPRIYDYFTWPLPLLTNVIGAAASGAMDLRGARGYRFENWFRTGQKKHKAFRAAVPLTTTGD